MLLYFIFALFTALALHWGQGIRLVSFSIRCASFCWASWTLCRCYGWTLWPAPCLGKAQVRSLGLFHPWEEGSLHIYVQEDLRQDSRTISSSWRGHLLSPWVVLGLMGLASLSWSSPPQHIHDRWQRHLARCLILRALRHVPQAPFSRSLGQIQVGRLPSGVTSHPLWQLVVSTVMQNHFL